MRKRMPAGSRRRIIAMALAIRRRGLLAFSLCQNPRISAAAKRLASYCLSRRCEELIRLEICDAVESGADMADMADAFPLLFTTLRGGPGESPV